MKWSVHSEKRKFTRKAAGKHRVIIKFIENYLKISKYRSLSAIQNIRGKWQNDIRYFAISNS